MLYGNRGSYIEVVEWDEWVEWNKPGDHPIVGYFRHPPVDPDTGQITAGGTAEETAILMGEMRHCDVPEPFRRSECNRIMHDHGYVDTSDGNGTIVCPGDMVLLLDQGRAVCVWHPEIFAKFYDRVDW